MEKEETSTISGGPIISYEGTADPELFAGFIAWLCTEDASDVTGQVFMTMGKFIGRYAIPTIPVPCSLILNGLLSPLPPIRRNFSATLLPPSPERNKQ